MSRFANLADKTPPTPVAEIAQSARQTPPPSRIGR